MSVKSFPPISDIYFARDYLKFWEQKECLEIKLDKKVEKWQ